MNKRIILERAKQALKNGNKYLLICADTMDRIKGNRDLGYYCVEVGTKPEVSSTIESCQIGTWHFADLRDYCESVVELSEPHELVFHDPATWLAQFHHKQVGVNN